jgi:hypothetical protein
MVEHRNLFIRLLIVLAVVGGLPSAAAGQATFGTIVGTVRD